MFRARRIPGLLLLLLPTLAAIASPAAAGWPANGLGVCTDPSDQIGPSITPDGSGGVIIAWRDRRDGSYFDVYAQRLTAAGDVAPGWPTNGALVCAAARAGSGPIAITDGADGAIIAWCDSRGGDSDIYAQHIMGSGAVDPGWASAGLPVCTAPDFQEGLVMVSDGLGGAVLAWSDYRLGADERDVYAQRISGTGAIVTGWPTNGLAICTADHVQSDVSIAADGAGGAVIAWDDARAGTPLTEDIYVQRASAAGSISAGWPADGVALIADGFRQVHPSIVADGAGGAFVVWQDTRDDAEGGLYAMRVRMTSALDPTWPAGGISVCAQPGSQRPTSLLADGAGGAYVAWEDDRSGIDTDAYLERITVAGALATGWTANGTLISNRVGYQSVPILARDAAGGVFVVWGWGDCCNGEMTAQRFSGAGAIASGWPADGFTVRASIGGTLAGAPVITSDLIGGTVVTWAEHRSGVLPFNDIYATRFFVDGPLPVQLSLVSAEAQSGIARLHWATTDGAVLRATVYRREETTEWRALASLSPDGGGAMSYEDRAVVAGHRYGYRLGVIESGEETFFGEAWVGIPDRAGLSLAGFQPNPTEHLGSVAYSLAGDGPARLEIFDIAGRAVVTRDLGSPGPGAHRVELPEAQAFRAGLYVLRLTQGASSVTARGVISR